MDDDNENESVVSYEDVDESFSFEHVTSTNIGILEI
jgi:hypothetical protein